MPDWSRVKLHVVTGKGGTGKTTVAASLALALASEGKDVLLCEVEGRQGIARLFDVDPLPYEERRIAVGLTEDGTEPGTVYGLHIDPESALLEYLAMYYRLGRAGRALDRFGVIEFATTLAPGVRDVLLTGKVFEAAKEGRRRGKTARQYDAVVLDAPPTGRIAQFLGVNSELAGLARVGPINTQAERVMKLFRSRRTAIHLVTVLEEMPVQETADGIEELRTTGLPVGAVVVNLVRPRDLGPEQLADAREGTIDRTARRGRPRGRRHRRRRRPGLRAPGRGPRPRRTPGTGGLAARHRRRPGRALLRAAAAGGRRRPRCALRVRRPPQGPGADVSTPRSTTSKTRNRARVGPLASVPASRATPLDVDALLDDPHTGIIVCCGSGGVGKTTVSAALALRAAERGRRVVVLTIDPARRLAQSMGIEELDNTPRPVTGVEGGPDGRGCLDAMMLDMKRTFDEVVESQATPEKAQQILANPFYIALSSSFAGTQEYMAMEKLGQIHARAQAEGSYDLIVVDTPPSRSALDFLDAPERLSSFLDGRFIRLLLAPAKGPARLMSAGVGLVTSAMTKVLGAQVLRDMQTFVAAFDTLFGGFRARAQKTFELLQADGTAFLVVAAPEPDALREAAYFVERLSEDRMPLAGMIVNRASPSPIGTLSADEAMTACARLEQGGTGSVAAGLLRLHADRSRLVERETELRNRFAAAHPRVPTTVVPALAGDVHDLDGLRQVGDLLAGT